MFYRKTGSVNPKINSIAFACYLYVNTIAIKNDVAQLLRIDCDAPLTTEQTTEQTTATKDTTDLSTRNSITTKCIEL